MEEFTIGDMTLQKINKKEEIRMSKIKLKDLSIWLKTGVILAWAWGISEVIVFIIGTIGILTGGN